MTKKQMGSSIDEFLKEEGIFEETFAVKEVAAWQLAQAKKKLSRDRLTTSHGRIQTQDVSTSVSAPQERKARSWGPRISRARPTERKARSAGPRKRAGALLRST